MGKHHQGTVERTNLERLTHQPGVEDDAGPGQPWVGIRGPNGLGPAGGMCRPPIRPEGRSLGGKAVSEE